MSLIVVGSSYRSADLPVLERLTVAPDEMAKVLDQLLASDHVVEAAVVSTCNRVEVYAVVSRFHPGLADILAWFTDRADIHPQDFEHLHYSFHDDRAAAHLFAVAGGLDSMVVGERQIGLQVRQAAEVARRHGAARRVLQRVFRQAALVARRLRDETSIADGASSMVEVGLLAAAQRLAAMSPAPSPRTVRRKVAIVGAGKMGALTAAQLSPDAVADVVVWNRSEDKARRLIGRLPVPATIAPTLAEAIAGVDLVVCTTGASQPLIDAELVAASRATSGDRPLVLLDLAVPRNVDPSCAELDGVDIVDVADVRDVVDRSTHANVLAQARVIVDAEADRFLAWTRERLVDPTIRDMRLKAEAVRQAEIDRLASRLNALDERQRAAVEALTEGIVNTLLHSPTVQLRARAEQGTADVHVAALRELFDLDE
ncbi:MAG: glutamyl-tRNA reductase [Nitriliruptoraceae bacterium]